LNGFKVSHLKDGLAFLKLFFWLEKNLSSQHLTEITISKKLYEFRSLEETFICESFATISAFKDNGAIIHYKADKSSDKKIDKDGLYLIDSGAHYSEGTTDTTRTIKIGKVSEEMINNYTLVLKGHIAIATAIFPKNTKGREIDSLARKALWSEGKDYAHGTGHGVGCLLSVHEGPISISKHSKCDIKQGMVISNEPGYYKNGEYGIRIENLEVVSKKYLKNSENFLYFENLTRVPFELELINKEILTIDEINWINLYHEKVYRELANLITPDDRELLDYLKIKTLPI
jgi:Xaa-Pro aminopeptidase